MTAYALMLTGRRLRALVVGGGDVAARKASAILQHVERIHVVAPRMSASLERLAREAPDVVSLSRREYAAPDVDDAELVFAATSVRAVNAQVAADARAARRLVNVADEPEDGSFVTPAQGGEPPLQVAVTAGVPDVSRRILEQIVARFDSRYARAASALGALRARLLAGERRAEWERARGELLGQDFCDSVEDGRFDARMAAWR